MSCETYYTKTCYTCGVAQQIGHFPHCVQTRGQSLYGSPGRSCNHCFRDWAVGAFSRDTGQTRREAAAIIARATIAQRSRS